MLITKNRILKSKKKPSGNNSVIESNKRLDSSGIQEKIQKKAYELYEKRGCDNGHDWEDWFEAEKIVTSEKCLCH